MMPAIPDVGSSEELAIMVPNKAQRIKPEGNPLLYAVFRLSPKGHECFSRYVLAGEAHALKLFPSVIVRPVRPDQVVIL
jgi:hypothetical protein